MTFHWSDYCHLARCLHAGKLEHGNDEARYRSAISRAYYAAFCTARNYIEWTTNRELPRDVQAHKAVQEWFAGRTDSPSRTVANHLATLWVKRRYADYDDSPRALDPNKDSALCIKMAEQVMEGLRQRR